MAWTDGLRLLRESNLHTELTDNVFEIGKGLFEDMA